MASNYVIMSIKLCLDVGNDKDSSLYNFGGLILSGFEVIEGKGERVPCGRKRNIVNKNRRKAIFNWAAKGLFFFRGEGAAIHNQATIKPCRRPLRETESHARLKHKLVQSIVPF